MNRLVHERYACVGRLHALIDVERTPREVGAAENAAGPYPRGLRVLRFESKRYKYEAQQGPALWL